MKRLRRRSRRILARSGRGVVFATVVLMVMVWTGGAASAQTGLNLRLRLPSWSQIVGWFESPHWGPLPTQQSGTAAGKPHAATTAATRAVGGTGSKPGHGAGQLPPFKPPAEKVSRGESGAIATGFNARTSVRVASKSTATSTYYKNTDGSFTRVLSESPVNYRGQAGGWLPINTSLVPAAGGRWAEKANSLSVSFSGSAADRTLASVGFGSGDDVSLSLAGALNRPAKVVGSTISYANVAPGTDLVFSPTAAGMAGSIVLHSAAGSNTWTFPLQLTGLKAVAEHDGSVGLVNAAGREVGDIPPAYAYDSSVGRGSGGPAGTHDVTYRLENVRGGEDLVVTLDEAWLRAPGRVFPVTVDPTVGSIGQSATTYVESGTGNTGDHSMEPTIKIGSDDPPADDAVSYIAFPGNGLDSSGVTVSAATLSLGVVYATTCSQERFDVAAVTQAWTPSALTSYPGPSYGASIGNASPTLSKACTNTALNPDDADFINVPLSTATFNTWAANGAKDFGLAIYASAADSLHWKQFNSANVVGGPSLALTYNNYLLPTVTSQHPGNGARDTTLTPVLAATGTWDTNLELKGDTLKYDFQVATATGTKVADSGLITPSDWTVPAGKLAWGQTYYWTVQTFDGVNYSLNPVWNALTTDVPQPVVTSTLSQNTGGQGFDDAIGNYTTSATDAQVNTVGPSLDVVRDYNSRDPRTSGAFGAAWSSIFDMRATPVSDASGALTSVIVTYPDGSEVGYGKNANGTFSPPEGRFATFQAVTGGYTLTDKNDTTYTFEQALGGGAYGITSVTDALGRAVGFTWSGGHITTMTSTASGRALHLTWSTPSGATSAHIATVATDPVAAGQASTALTWSYFYSGDELSRVCPPGTTSACTDYQYQTGSPYQPEVLDEGASSYWPMSEAAGATTAQDAVLANEGADNASYTDVTLGTSGGPLAGSDATVATFNGTSSVVNLPSLRLGEVPEFSVSLWFKTTSTDEVLFSASDNPLQATSDEGNFVPSLYVGTDGKLNGLFWPNIEPTPIVSSAAVNDGKWHQVVLASAPGTQTMWLDGKEVGTQPGWSALGDDLDAPWLLKYGYIGSGYLGYLWPDQPHMSKNSLTVYASYFNGEIADAAYFTRALTQSDVTSMYSAASGSQALLTKITRPSGKTYASVGYDSAAGTVTQVTDENGGTWKLAAPVVTGSSQVYRSAVLGAGPADYFRLGDSAGATTAANEVNGGTAQYNDVSLGASGPFTDLTAASFDGSTSYVSLPSGLLTGSTQSVGIWFRTTKPSEVLLGGASGPLTAAPFPGFDAMLYVGSDGKLVGEAWTGTAYTPMESSALVDDGKWHFAVLTAAGSTQALYLDGSQVASKSGTVDMAGLSDETLGAGWLGATWPDNSLSGKLAQVQYFDGTIAEAAFYPRALSAAAVAQQYTAASNSQGLLPVESVTVTDPGGKNLVDRYDVDNGYRLISSTDGAGHTTSYGYDSSGFLYTVTDPNGDVTTTGHDVRGNVVSQTTCQDQAAGKCSTAYYTYYPDDTTAQLTKADPRNDLVLTVRDGRSSSATDNTYLTTYTYDQYGDKTAVTTPPVPGFPSGRTTTISYSTPANPVLAVNGGDIPNGLPVRTVSPGGAVNTIAYYHDGDVAATTNADGLVTLFTYDNLGRALTKTALPNVPVGWWRLNQSSGSVVPDSSGTGNALTASNVTWNGSYGAFNGTSSEIKGTGSILNSGTDLSVSAWVKIPAVPSTWAEVADIGTPGSPAMELFYSPQSKGWAFAVTDSAASSPDYYTATTSKPPALNAWTHLVGVYSAASRTVSLYINGTLAATAAAPAAGDASGSGTFYIGALNGANPFNGDIANVQIYQRAISASEVKTLYTAGWGGAVRVGTSPAGLVTSYAYDGQDNVIKETDPPVTDHVTGKVHTAVTTSVYDVDGDLTSQSVADTTGGDPTRTTSTQYNQYDEPSASIDADGHKTTYTYDAYGNQTSETEPDGQVLEWTYDADGHQLTQTLESYTGSPLHPQPAAPLVEWSKSYDPAGRLASVTDSMGNVTRYTYYDDNLPATTVKTNPSGTSSYLVESEYYDGAGNLIKQVTNNGATTQELTLDAADRTTSTVLDPTGADRVTTYSYTPDDQVATTTQSGSSGGTEVTAATYDPMGDQTSQSVYQDTAGHPAGWWPLAQGSGALVTDASGGGNSAHESGATWTGTSASFAGVAGQQIATNGPVLNTTGSFSVSAWVDLPSIPGGFETAVSQDASENSGFYLQYDYFDHAWAFSMVTADTANAPGIRAHAATAPTVNTWYQLLGTYDASTGALTLYVDGKQAGTATDARPVAAGGPLAIGRAKFNGSPTDLFHGQIANVQVYNQVLTASDASSLYAKGRGGGTLGSSTPATTHWALDPRGLPETMTDPDGKTTSYTYDQAGDLAVTTDPAVAAESGGGAAKQVQPSTVTGWDTFGQPVSTRDADGNVTTTVYDGDGNKLSQTLPSYTPPGATKPITATTRWAYDGNGELVKQTDPLGSVTSYVYDQLGDLVQTIAPDGGKSDAVYDTDGQQTSSTDPDGATSQATYDYLGRQLTATTLERYPSVSASTVTYSYQASASDPGGAFLASTTTQDGAVTGYGYDDLGEQTSVTDPAGNTTSSAYDFLGRTATTTTANGTVTAQTYDALGDITGTSVNSSSGALLTHTSATYDLDGDRLSSTNADGHTTTYSYDATGLLTKEVQPVSAKSSITTSYGYDASGNLTRYTDGDGNKWVYTYNSWNLPASEIEPETPADGTPALSTTTTAYNADGQPVRTTEPGGVTITDSYDSMGDLTGQTGSGANAPTSSRSFTYNDDGEMTSASASAAGTSGKAGYQPASSENFAYNDRGNLLTATGSGGSSSFGYNGDDLVTSVKDAAGTTTYGYNVADQLNAVSDPATGTSIAYAYNDMDQVSSVTYGAGGDVQSFGYNALSELTSDTLTSGTAKVAAITYGYDPAGNLTSKDTTGFDGSSDNTYTYDYDNRLTSWTSGSKATQYAYDGTGNRTKAGANTFTYDARDELTSEKTATGTTTYSYTANGTLAKQSSASGTVTLTSDAYGQQISDGTRNYSYDALGRTLTDKPSGSGKSYAFSYSGADGTIASDGTNTYTYDSAGDLLAVGTASSGGSGGTVPGSGLLAFTDQHTDVVGEFAPTAAGLSGSATYDPLGNVLATAGMKGSIGYQSGWTDPVTGKVDMSARWYNPATGQFMNKDSASLNPTANPTAANPFAYAADNPLTGTDPTGMCWSGFGWACSAASWVNNNIIQPAWHWTDQNIIQPVENFADKAWQEAEQSFDQLEHEISEEIAEIDDEIAQIDQEIAQLKREAHAVVTSVVTKARSAAHTLDTAYHVVVAGASKAVASAATFVKNHATTIVSTAVGIGTFIGCDALTAGVGTIGCAALAGAAASGVSYAMTCGKTKAGCSAGGAFEAIGIGAVSGAVGGALAGPLGGELVGNALDGVLPDIVTSALTGAYAGAGSGAVAGGLGYGLNCGSSKAGCSWSGLGSAVASGAEQGAIGGGIGGAAAGALSDLATTFRSPSGDNTPATPEEPSEPAAGQPAGPGNPPGPAGGIPSPRGIAGDQSPVIEIDTAGPNWSQAERLAQVEQRVPVAALFSRTAATASRTYVGGLNIDTGDTVIASSGGLEGCNSYCAEGNAINALGGDSSRVILTKAYQVKRIDGLLTAVQKEVCPSCQVDYPDPARPGFVPGTRGVPGGVWGDQEGYMQGGGYRPPWVP